MQVKNFQAGHTVQILDFLYLVLTQNQYLKRLNRRLCDNFFYLVACKVQKGQVWETNDVFDLRDLIVIGKN